MGYIYWTGEGKGKKEWAEVGSLLETGLELWKVLSTGPSTS